jgi:hypothetical protein
LPDWARCYGHRDDQADALARIRRRHTIARNLGRAERNVPQSPAKKARGFAATAIVTDTVTL